jgi:hypothetical protein
MGDTKVVPYASIGRPGTILIEMTSYEPCERLSTNTRLSLDEAVNLRDRLDFAIRRAADHARAAHATKAGYRR